MSGERHRRMLGPAAARQTASLLETRVVLYTRPDCPLCEWVRHVVVELCERRGLSWRELDVDRQVRMRERFGARVPVVFLDGELVSELDFNPDDFITRLG